MFECKLCEYRVREDGYSFSPKIVKRETGTVTDFIEKVKNKINNKQKLKTPSPPRKEKPKARPLKEAPKEENRPRRATSKPPSEQALEEIESLTSISSFARSKVKKKQAG
jgi:hypothetical protein